MKEGFITVVKTYYKPFIRKCPFRNRWTFGIAKVYKQNNGGTCTVFVWVLNIPKISRP